ncbi:MAG: aldehyde dehydrogenase family protein [SAR324 cluster bacterium]|nr:aldehyde dehydrogenase family protein [SAR324 cluster bacterium]
MNEDPTSKNWKFELKFPRVTDVPSEFSNPRQITSCQYLINGDIPRWEGPFQEIFSPVQLEQQDGIAPYKLGSYPLLDSEEAFHALKSAVKAYNDGRGLWPSMSTTMRIEYVESFIKRVLKQKHNILALMMWSLGKPLAHAEKEFELALNYIEDTVRIMKSLINDTSRFFLDDDAMLHIHRYPVGVVLIGVESSQPLLDLFMMIIPALILGNSLIIRAPEYGGMIFTPLLNPFRDSFPRGVVNVICGNNDEVIVPLLNSRRIHSLGFAWHSSVTTRILSRHPAPWNLHSVFRHESKNVALILADADVDEALDDCVQDFLGFSGQYRSTFKILFVHEKVLQEVQQKLIQKIDNNKIGFPWEPDVNITPLWGDGRVQDLEEMIRDAVEKGASVINPHGGESLHGFMYPAVVSGITEKMRMYSEAHKGPVIPIIAFEHVETLLQYVIHAYEIYQVSIFGNDSESIANLVDLLLHHVDWININSAGKSQIEDIQFSQKQQIAQKIHPIVESLNIFSSYSLVTTEDLPQNRNILREIVEDTKSSFIHGDPDKPELL